MPRTSRSSRGAPRSQVATDAIHHWAQSTLGHSPTQRLEQPAVPYIKDDDWRLEEALDDMVSDASLGRSSRRPGPPSSVDAPTSVSEAQTILHELYQSMQQQQQQRAPPPVSSPPRSVSPPSPAPHAEQLPEHVRSRLASAFERSAGHRPGRLSASSSATAHYQQRAAAPPAQQHHRYQAPASAAAATTRRAAAQHYYYAPPPSRSHAAAYSPSVLPTRPASAGRLLPAAAPRTLWPSSPPPGSPTRWAGRGGAAAPPTARASLANLPPPPSYAPMLDLPTTHTHHHNYRRLSDLYYYGGADAAGPYYHGGSSGSYDDALPPPDESAEARIVRLYAAWLRSILRAWHGFALECSSTLTELLDQATPFFLSRRALRRWVEELPTLRTEMRRNAAADRFCVKRRLRYWRWSSRVIVSCRRFGVEGYAAATAERLHECFLRWRQMRFRRAAMKGTRKVVRFLRVRGGFSLWQARAKEWRYWTAFHARAVQQHRRQCSRALRVWRGTLIHAEVCRRLVSQGMGHALSHALEVWRDAGMERKLSAALALGAARQGRRLAKSSALKAWRKRAHQFRTLRLGLGRLLHLRVAHAVNAWHEMAVEAAHSPTSQLIERILGSKSQRWQRIFFKEWEAWSRALAHQKRGGKRALGHLVHRAVAPAFVRWVGAWHHSQREKLIRERARLAFFGDLGRSWRTWAESCRLRNEALAAARKTVRRWRGKQLLVGWNQWVSTAEALVTSKAQLTSALAAFRNDMRRRALHTWVEYSHDASMFEVRASKALDALTGSGVLKAWNQIVTLWRARSRALNVLRKAAGTFYYRGLSRALRAWKARVIERRMELRAARAMDPKYRTIRKAWNSWRANARVLLSGQRVVRRMIGRRLLRAFNSLVEEADLRQRARRALLVLRFAREAEAFRTWHEHGLSLSVTRNVAKQAIKRLRQAGKAKAWTTWVDFAKWRRWLLWRPAARFRHLGASRALNAWVDLVERRAAQIELAVVAIRRMLGRHAMRVLRRWRGKAAEYWLDASRRQQAVEYHGWAACATMMGRWVALAKEGEDDEARVEQVSLALRRHIALRVLKTWRLHSQVVIASYLAVLNGQIGSTRAKLRRGFRRLSRNRRPAKVLIAVLHAVLEPVRKAFSSWALDGKARHRYLGAVKREKAALLRQWRDLSTYLKKLRTTVRSLFARSRDLTLRSALSAWMASISTITLALTSFLRGQKHERRRILKASMATMREWYRYVDAAAMLLGQTRKARRRIAFERWRRDLSRRADNKQTLRRSARLWRGGLLALCLGDWRDRAKGLRTAKRFAQRATRLDKGNGLRHWREATKASMRRAQLRKLCDAHARLGAGLSSFRRWRRMRRQRAERRERRRRLFAAFLKLKERRGLNTWMAYAEDARTYRGRATRALTRLSPGGRAKGRALESWKGRLEEARTFQHVLFRLRHLGLVRGWHTWAANADERAHHAAKLRRVLVTLSPVGRAKRRAFNQIIFLVETREQLRIAIARLQHGSVTRCINTWKGLADGHDRIKRVLLGLRHPGLRKCFQTWRHTPPHPARVVLWRWKHNRLLAGFNTWYERLVERENRRRALAHLLNHGLAKGLASWAEYMRLRRLLKRATSAWGGHGLAVGFNTWEAFCSQRGKMLGLLGRALAAMKSATLRRCFNSFAAVLDAPRDPKRRALLHLVHHSQARAFMTWLEGMERWRRARGALVHWFSNGVGRAFGSWADAATARGGRLQTLQRGLAALLRRCEFRALQQWREMADARASAQLVIRKVRMQGAMRALNSWCAHHETASEQRRLLNKTARRFAADPLALTFDKWRRASAHLSAFKASLAALASPEVRHLLRALNTWRDEAQSWLHRRGIVRKLLSADLAKGLRTWQHLTASYAFVKRMASRMLLRDALRAFGTWRDGWATYKMAQRLGLRLLGWEIAKALDRWFEYREERQRLTQVAYRVLRASGQEARAFRALVAYSDARREAVGRLAVAARRWASPALSQALNRWREIFDEIALMAKALVGLVRLREARAFRRWIEMAAERLLHRGLAMRIFSKTTRRLARAWAQWAGVALGYADTLQTLGRAVGSWRNKHLARGFRQLAAHADERQRLLGVLRSALTNLANAAVARAHRTWAEAAHRRKAALLMARRIGRQGEVRALNHWVARTTARHSLYERISLVVDVLSGRGLAAALFQWRASLARQRMLVLIVLRGFQRKQIYALTYWRASVHELLAPARACLEVGALMMTALALRRGFNALRDYWFVRSAALRDYRERHLVLGSLFSFQGLRWAFTTWSTAAFDAALTSAAVAVAKNLFILSALRQAMGSWAAVVYHLKHSLSKSSVIAEQRATLRIWRWRMLDRKKARLQFNSMVKYATTRWMQWALYQPFSRWRYKLMVRRERTVRQEEVSPTSRDRGNRRGSVPASFKAHSPSPAAHTLRGVPDNIRVRLPPPSPP